MLGVVNLDKPVGPTSHDMVSLMRRLTGTRRIGHAGTLDPLASGVLPILVGGATRFSAELTGGEKRYAALVRLGWRSETDDGEGPLERGSAVPSDERLREAFAAFVGTFMQRPPAYSARKQAGQIAYRAARGGVPIDLPSRTVTVHQLDIVAIRRDADAVDVRIDLRSGAGTYVRSIARDVGEALGCGAYLAELRRTEAAGLKIAEGRTPEMLERLAAEGGLGAAILPIADLLPLARIELEPDAAARFRNGLAQQLVAAESTQSGRRAVLSGGTLVGIGRLTNGMLQPEKVLAQGGA